MIFKMILKHKHNIEFGSDFVFYNSLIYLKESDPYTVL